MAKRIVRGQSGEQIESLMPDVTQKVPKEPKTLSDKERELEKWGYPTSTRLNVQERAAIEMLADEYDTTITEMMRLCVRIGIAGIGTGKYTPRLGKGRRSLKIVDHPDLPERFR